MIEYIDFVYVSKYIFYNEHQEKETDVIVDMI